MRTELQTRPRFPPRSGRRNFYLGLLIGVAIVVAYQTVLREKRDSTSDMPAAEAAFVRAVGMARTEWLSAPNDLAKTSMRAARAAALCHALPGLSATAWHGRISRIDPDGFPDYRGKATVRIVIALTSYLSVSTPSAPLLNNPATMVEAGTPLYAEAAVLPIGAPVVFSGAFFPSNSDCMQETSLTLDGSMSNPRFKLALTALAP